MHKTFTHPIVTPRGLRRSTSAAAALLALLLAGCAVGPDYQRPELPQPASLTRGPLATEGQVATVDAQWWTAFGSPELDAQVQEALTHSPTLEAARATLRAARQNVIAQRGFFFPSVGLGYEHTRQNSGESMSSALDSGEPLYSYHTAQLSISYTPDILGANRRQVEGLQAAEENQRLQLQAAQLTLTGNLVAAVIQSAMLQEQVALTTRAVDTAQQQLRHMHKQQENGFVSGLDVATQQTLLLELEQSLPPMEVSLEQTRNLVATLLGRTPDAAPAVPALASFHLPALPKAVASQLVEQRPDVRAAETEVQQASAAVGVAKAERLPQLSITAAYGGGATRFSQMFAAGNSVWSVGAGLLQPLFNGGTLRAKQRAAEAELEAAAASYRGTVLAAFQDVANALYAMDGSARALRMSEQSEHASQTTWKLTQSQFQQGFAGKPALLAAEQAYLQAQAATVGARGSQYGDAVALFQSLGGSVLQQH